MTSQLRATLLGEVRFEYGGADVTPTSLKGTALLAYLCLASTAARRDGLADLLWSPGRRANLRQELYGLRRLAGAAAWLLEDGELVSVEADTDVSRLARALLAAGPSHLTPLPANLLPGLDRVDAPAFRAWLEHERESVNGLATRAVRAAIDRHEAEGRYREAQELVDGALTYDLLDEALHRAGIRLAHRLGDHTGAWARLGACREVLRRELGAEPAAETIALVEGLGGDGMTAVHVGQGGPEPRLERLAQALALADGALDVEALAAVLELEPLDVASDLARLERAGRVDSHLALAPPFAESILRAAPAGVRRLLHQRIARALQGAEDVPLEKVARHLLRAGQPAAAAPLLLRAALALVERTAPAEAVPLLLQVAWAAWEDASTRLQAYLLLEGCAAQLSDEALQEAALTQAEALAWELQRDVELAEVRMRRSRSLLRRGSVGEGMERALEALEIAVRLADERLLARARNAVGAAQFYAGDLAGAERSFEANVAAADLVERYRARNNLGSIAGIGGRHREALSHLEEALTLARSAGKQADVVGTLNNLAATADRVGHYRRAVRHFKESLALARRSGSVGLEGQVLVNLSVVYSRLGELGPAWNTADEVEEMAGQLGDERLALRAREQKAEVASLCGLAELAAAEFGAAARVAAALGDERKEAQLIAQRAVAAARGAPQLLAEAASTLASLEGPRRADVAPWLWLELALATAEPSAADAWLARARAEELDNRHFAYVARLAELRLGLLPGADAAQLSRAGGAREGLSDEAPGIGSETEAGFVQEPLAWLLGDLWDGTRRRPQRPKPDPEVLGRVRRELVRQGLGLPRALALSLAERPTAWLANLTDTPLTPV